VHRITFAPDGSAASNTVWAKNPDKLKSTDGMILDGEGNLYIADFSANAIVKVKTDATVEIVSESSFYLLEALAGAIGKMLLSYDLVQYGKVSLFKAAGSAAGKGVRIEMEFQK
jgi:hypothetical protein